MAIAFARSSLALESDRGRVARVVLCISIGLSGAWIAWLLFGRVTLVETASSARVEVHRAAHGVQVPLGGRVAAARLTLGARVAAGDVLLELDGTQLRLTHAERQARVQRIEAELGQLLLQIDAQARALRQETLAGPARIAQARAREEQANAALSFARTEAARARQLQALHAISDAQLLGAEREGDTLSAAAKGYAAAVARAEAEQRAQESAQEVELKRLSREAARLRGERAEELAALDLLAQRIEDLRIKAPVAGVLGEVASLHAGSVVRDGDRIASVVPDGPLKVSARYAPERAVGRIAPGQTARVRLDGFPWTQFGSIPARVTRVGDEPSDGLVRVELDVAPAPSARVRLQHGLPGSVLVEVERIAPLDLLLRVLGKLLRDHTP